MIVNSLSSSWEEKAFAEDISNNFQGLDGSIGGCVWPPRSYSCAFCLREFRSAQALGGHMNIHRRDRARLKQKSPIGVGNNNIHNNKNMFCPQRSSYSSSSTDNIFDQNSPLKPLVNNLNNLDPNNSTCFNSCPSSYNNKTQPRSYYFPSSLPYNYPSRVSSHVPRSDDYLSIGVMLDLEKKKNTNIPREFEDYDDHDNSVETNSSPRFRDEIMIDRNASGDSKRPAGELLFLLKPLQSAVNNNIHEVKSVASMDNLDLELRLGHAKVL